MPVLLVFIHVDGFLRFVSLDELFFSFFVSVLIFEMESVLQVNLRHLVFCVVFCKSECSFKSLLVGFKVNGCLDETILNQELSSFLGSHVFSNLNCNFSKLFLGSVGLCNSEGFFPHVLSTVHVYGV